MVRVSTCQEVSKSNLSPAGITHSPWQRLVESESRTSCDFWNFWNFEVLAATEASETSTRRWSRSAPCDRGRSGQIDPPADRQSVSPSTMDAFPLATPKCTPCRIHKQHRYQSAGIIAPHGLHKLWGLNLETWSGCTLPPAIEGILKSIETMWPKADMLESFGVLQVSRLQWVKRLCCAYEVLRTELTFLLWVKLGSEWLQDESYIYIGDTRWYYCNL